MSIVGLIYFTMYYFTCIINYADVSLITNGLTGCIKYSLQKHFNFQQATFIF